MFAKKLSDGNYYLCSSRNRNYRSLKNEFKRAPIRKSFIVKDRGNCGVIQGKGNPICFPKELIGKRIRFKIEVI